MGVWTIGHFGNSSGETVQFKTVDLHASCWSVLGFSFRNYAKRASAIVEACSLKIKIVEQFRLAEAAKAQKWVESRQSTGKALLRFIKKLVERYFMFCCSFTVS
ncbi:hypothetical protein [Peribacillus sp. NPDC096540]|uniref:hypothetical protein n=1 Tax=Peribacillus sp. NPDC096540 TaxID=3390612 RepID=UPI003D0288AA